MTHATNVRLATWAALAVASAAMVAVVTAATRPTTPAAPSPSRPIVAAISAPAPDTKPNAAVADESAPAIIDYAAPKVGPDEPAIEVGSSTLALRLRDADTGQSADAKVVLWRLGVRADEFWSAGDQEYARATTSGGVVRIERLPPGRFRICVNEQRKGAEDPPEFVVGAGVNEVERAIRPVRSFHFRVLVVDDAGAPVASGTLRNLGGGGSFGPDATPAWATTRTPLWPGAPSPGFAGFASGDGFGERTGQPVRSVAGVFDLVTFEETSRTVRTDNSWEFTPPCGERVRLYVSSDSAADVTLVHVVPRPGVLVAHVTCPDGSKLDPSTAKIDAMCESVRWAWPPPADAWRVVPVRVTVVRDGCEPLVFHWTAATADAEHRLVASRAESPK